MTSQERKDKEKAMNKTIFYFLFILIEFSKSSSELGIKASHLQGKKWKTGITEKVKSMVNPPALLPVNYYNFLNKNFQFLHL